MLTALLAVVLAQPAAAPDPAEKARFDKAADYSAEHAGRAVLIQRAGKTVYERYDNGGSAATPQPLASGTKSFTGVAAMFAVQDKLFTLDEQVAGTITEWSGDPKKSQITVRHLLTLSSGLQADGDGVKARNRDLNNGRREGLEALAKSARNDWFKDAVNAPMTGTAGGQFEYGGNHFYVFGEFLERKLKASELPEKTAWDYYTARIFKPIGLDVARIGRDVAGHPNLPGGCSLTAREWVKFGQFVLDGGAWAAGDGTKTQLLAPDLLAQCFVPSEENPFYGLTFWLRRSGQEATNPMRPDAGTGGPARERIAARLRSDHFGQQVQPVTGPDGKPIEVRMAAGLGGQKLYILPQYGIVVVRFARIGDPAGRTFDDKPFLADILNIAKEEGPGDKPTK
ncbi:MAG TPA: serine hydrolase domain-containing protein [Phycisphaerales bacterium]|nr:serine hydrolase domain-containing protein [Phycisphaerales bacterium]